MTATTHPTGDLIETFGITLPGGATLTASLHRTDRRSGRRVLVREYPGGPLLWDSDDCHAAGNVRAKLEQWLATVE